MENPLQCLIHPIQLNKQQIFSFTNQISKEISSQSSQLLEHLINQLKTLEEQFCCNINNHNIYNFKTSVIEKNYQNFCQENIHLYKNLEEERVIGQQISNFIKECSLKAKNLLLKEKKKENLQKKSLICRNFNVEQEDSKQEVDSGSLHSCTISQIEFSDYGNQQQKQQAWVDSGQCINSVYLQDELERCNFFQAQAQIKSTTHRQQEEQQQQQSLSLPMSELKEKQNQKYYSEEEEFYNFEGERRSYRSIMDFFRNFSPVIEISQSDMRFWEETKIYK